MTLFADFSLLRQTKHGLASTAHHITSNGDYFTMYTHFSYEHEWLYLSFLKDLLVLDSVTFKCSFKVLPNSYIHAIITGIFSGCIGNLNNIVQLPSLQLTDPFFIYINKLCTT